AGRALGPLEFAAAHAPMSRDLRSADTYSGPSEAIQRSETRISTAHSFQTKWFGNTSSRLSERRNLGRLSNAMRRRFSERRELGKPPGTGDVKNLAGNAFGKLRVLWPSVRPFCGGSKQMFVGARRHTAATQFAVPLSLWRGAWPPTASRTRGIWAL